MRNVIFDKAVKLQKHLVNTGKTEYVDFYQFNFKDDEPVLVRVENSARGTEIKCSCKHCTFNYGENRYLCSYKIAVILSRCK